MPRFPTKQADIKALAYTIAIGVWNHRDDFPNIDVFEIAAVTHQYISARNTQNQAISAAKLTTKAKNISLKNLKDIMRNYLKKSEVDVADNPEKLRLIGWGPKAASQPIDSPGQPNNLRSVNQGWNKVTLQWDSPTGGGAVQNYIIQRRCQKKTDGKFDSWKLIATTFKNHITLTNQPKKITLEYRIKAVNISGESLPSNIAVAVL